MEMMTVEKQNEKRMVDVEEKKVIVLGPTAESVFASDHLTRRY